jgi:hypothetical protein
VISNISGDLTIGIVHRFENINISAINLVVKVTNCNIEFPSRAISVYSSASIDYSSFGIDESESINSVIRINDSHVGDLSSYNLVNKETLNFPLSMEVSWGNIGILNFNSHSQVIATFELSHSYLHVVVNILCEIQPFSIAASIHPEIASITRMRWRFIEKSHILRFACDTAEVNLSIVVDRDKESIASISWGLEISAVNVARKVGTNISRGF